MTTHTNTTSGIDPGAFAVQFIEKRAAAYADENASTEPDTGATSWHYGEAGRDYYNTLVELADDIREALARRAEQTATGTGECWSCKRAYTDQQRADADGHCPHCGVEIEVEQASTGDADERARFDQWMHESLFANPPRAVDPFAAWTCRAALAKQAAAQPVGEIVMYANYSTVVHWKPVMPPAGTKLYTAPVVDDAGAQAAAQPTLWRWCWEDSRGASNGWRYTEYQPPAESGKIIEAFTPAAAQTDDARDAAQSDNGAAANAGGQPTVAWLIEWKNAVAGNRRLVSLHNCAADVRAEHGNATITELVPRAAATSAPQLSDDQIIRIAGDVRQRNAGAWPGSVAFARAILDAAKGTAGQDGAA